MQRTLLLLALVLLTLAAAAPPAVAQQADWPVVDVAVRANDPHSFARGPGGYLSIAKIVLLWVLAVAWLAAAGWVDRDARQVRMPFHLWNPIVTFTFLVGFLLFGLTVPIFFIGYFLTLLCLAGPVGAYIFLRNRQVPAHERVLTPEHLRHLLSRRAGAMGVKVAAERKRDYEKGPPVQLLPAGNAQADQANLILARNAAGYLPAKVLTADALARRAEKVMLDFTQQTVAVRYQIDGVWHDVESQDRATGDGVLWVLKKVAGLAVEDRRSRQQGALVVELPSGKVAATLISQGTQTGERAIVHFASREPPATTLAEAGMRDKLQEQLAEVLGRPAGLVLLSAMPGGGLSLQAQLVLRSMDRFLRDFISVEDAAQREPEVDNVPVETYNGAAGETPDAVLPRIIRKEPDVLVVRDLPNAETVRLLCQEASDDRLVLAQIRAKEAVEALLRVLLLKVPAKEFARAVAAVLNVRLIRRLCEDCKEAYAPPAELLAKLGLPPDRVQQLYRPASPPPPEAKKPEICKTCGGLGYRGRIGIYELLVVTDGLRAALVQQPKLEVLRKVARQGGHRGLQEEGLLLVARGATSLPELQRVLKQ